MNVLSNSRTLIFTIVLRRYTLLELEETTRNLLFRKCHRKLKYAGIKSSAKINNFKIN